MYSQPQGKQWPPDGTSPGAENLLHQHQIASHNEMHPTSYHHIPNNPFIESATNSRFHSSAIGLYGSEAHDGNSSSANFDLQFNELGSRAQSIPPCTPMIWEHSRGFSTHPAPTMQSSTSLFHNTLPHDSVSVNQLIFQQILTEIQTVNNHLNHIESTNRSILENQKITIDHIQQNENTLKELQESIDVITAVSKNAASKNISNQHPKLKLIVLPIFFELCGVDIKVADRRQRTELLAKNAPLLSGEPYEVINGEQLWRPRWGATIYDKVNALYIAEVIQRVWDNETSLRNDPNKKPEMDDEDYDRTTITTIAKAYWRKLARQVSSQVSAERTEKYANKLKASNCCQSST